MLNAALVVVGAVLVWLTVDRLVCLLQQRSQVGHWTDIGADRGFHSTGWEETVSPLEALEPIVDPRRPRDFGRVAD